MNKMNRKQVLKLTFLYLCKHIGLFRLACRPARQKLLILCYHGFELTDEARFRPSLFMRRQLFARRLMTIHRYGFPVLPLDEALRRLKDGTLPDNAVCITIDDGFYSVLAHAAPLLKQYAFPATLYVTSYYVAKRTPIFRLVVQYMFWKSNRDTVDFSDQPWGLPQPIDLTDAQAQEQAAWQIIRFGEKQCDEPGRQRISELLGQRLDVSYERIAAARMLHLLTTDELRELAAYGIDVQLHTHRHLELPVEDEVAVRQEVRENRLFLERHLAREMAHFCYPSGQWDRQHWPWLAASGVQSATTCDPGLNTQDTAPLGLYRVLDSNRLSQIEFEAELFGFAELCRQLTGKRRRSERIRESVFGKKLYGRSDFPYTEGVSGQADNLGSVARQKPHL